MKVTGCSCAASCVPCRHQRARTGRRLSGSRRRRRRRGGGTATGPARRPSPTGRPRARCGTTPSTISSCRRRSREAVPGPARRLRRARQEVPRRARWRRGRYRGHVPGPAGAVAAGGHRARSRCWRSCSARRTSRSCRRRPERRSAPRAPAGKYEGRPFSASWDGARPAEGVRRGEPAVRSVSAAGLADVAPSYQLASAVTVESNCSAAGCCRGAVALAAAGAGTGRLLLALRGRWLDSVLLHRPRPGRARRTPPGRAGGAEGAHGAGAGVREDVPRPPPDVRTSNRSHSRRVHLSFPPPLHFPVPRTVPRWLARRSRSPSSVIAPDGSPVLVGAGAG